MLTISHQRARHGDLCHLRVESADADECIVAVVRGVLTPGGHGYVDVRFFEREPDNDALTATDRSFAAFGSDITVLMRALAEAQAAVVAHEATYPTAA